MQSDYNNISEKNIMADYGKLFWTFFKIGTFTIGGGLAMLPLIEREIVDKNHWLTRGEYLDMVALSQAMPGVVAVNIAASLGYKLRGRFGAIVAVTANVLMPIIIMLLLAVFFKHFKNNSIVERIFKGIRPCVVALIAVPVFTLAKNSGLTWRNCWIPIVAALLIWLFGVSPVWVILVAALGGLIYGRYKSGGEVKL